MKRVINLGYLIIVTTIVSCNSGNKTDKKIEQVTVEKEKEALPVAAIPSPNEIFVGSWVEPNPINKDEVQGFELMKDGTAKSINMATLIYKNWWAENNKLFLVSESIGNHTSAVDTIAYDIKTIDDSNLVLQERQRIIKYKRK